MRDPDVDIQAALAAGKAVDDSDRPDAAAYQKLFAGLEQGRGLKVPGGFAFRVMDRIISLRLRTAEQQAKRHSLLAAILLITAAMLGSLVSVQFGWTNGAWLARLPLQHMLAAGLGFLLLILLDFLVETHLQTVDQGAAR
jgi:hypothetical protein